MQVYNENEQVDTKEYKMYSRYKKYKMYSLKRNSVPGNSVGVAVTSAERDQIITSKQRSMPCAEIKRGTPSRQDHTYLSFRLVKQPMGFSAPRKPPNKSSDATVVQGGLRS